MRNMIRIGIPIVLLGLLFLFITMTKTNHQEKEILISYGDLNIYLEGMPYSFTHKNPNTIESFRYRNKVYMPLLELSDALGKDIKISKNKKRVYIYTLPSNHINQNNTSNAAKIENNLVMSSKTIRKVKAHIVSSLIYLDGEMMAVNDLKERIFFIEGVPYITLALAEEILDRDCIWSEDTRGIYVQSKTSQQYIVDSSTTFTLEKLNNVLDKWASLYDFIKINTIGTTIEGRNIYSVVVDYKENIFKNKEKVLFVGGIHAREDYSVLLNAKMLDSMLYHLTTDGKWGPYNLDDLFSKVELHVIIAANPDGLNIVHNGIQSSENYRYLKTIPDLAADIRWWKANGRGVDLNRNFPDSNWHLRDTTIPASEGYKGTHPASERETKDIVKYCVDNAFLLSVSLHTSGNSVFWADKGTHSTFNNLDSDMIDRYVALTGYEKLAVSELPEFYGSGFENWFRETFQRPSFCVELSPYPGIEYVQHPDSCFDALVWNHAKYTAPFFMKEALDLREKIYDVYQEDIFVKSFYNREEAMDYLEQNENSKVVYKGKEILVNN